MCSRPTEEPNQGASSRSKQRILLPFGNPWYELSFFGKMLMVVCIYINYKWVVLLDLLSL